MADRSAEPALPPRPARMWVQAVRPFSFTASIVPVLLGSAVAATQGMFNPGLFFLTLLGAVGIQAAANLFSDYFDYRGGYQIAASCGYRRGRFPGILPPSGVFLAGPAVPGIAPRIVPYPSVPPG